MASADVMKPGHEGLKSYYQGKIDRLELVLHAKQADLRRLEAQRNELNARVRRLRDELQKLQDPGSYIGEVIKVMGKTKVLVKVHPEGKYVVNAGPDIDLAVQCPPGTRVALRNDSYTLHKVLPSKVDPLVSLMKVEKVPDATYEMVGGLEKQVKEMKEVIELPIKHPELFESLGISQPKGVIMFGPPGTGKTLLARAVAHHTECTFIRVSGSELVQKYIGEGSRMVRELFVMARQHAPSIIFMDEIDSIGGTRIDSSSGGDSEVQRTMLELLNQLDGFEPSQNIKVLMATNRIDILDPALLRPGRIDRKIEFPNPNEASRLQIIKIHSRKMNLMRGINLRKIANQMKGASGAESKAVCLTGDHRVLTRVGWRSITSMKVGDVVLSLNINADRKGKYTWAMEWKPVLAVQCYDVKPDRADHTLYRMQGSGMDIVATRDHSMLVARLSQQSGDGLQDKPIGYETVHELLSLTYGAKSHSKGTCFTHNQNRAVVCAGLNTQPAVKIIIPGLERVCEWWWERDQQLAFLQFLGFWLGDGGLDTRHGQVTISQKKVESCEWIEKLLPQVLPGWWRRYQRSNGFVEYHIRCPPLYEYLRRMAAGPLGYNPRDPVELRSYPHFTYNAELAALEQKAAYYKVHRSDASTWTETEMLARMRKVAGVAAGAAALPARDTRQLSVSAATTESSALRSIASNTRRSSFSVSSMAGWGASDGDEEQDDVVVDADVVLISSSSPSKKARVVKDDEPEVVTFHDDEEVPAAAPVAVALEVAMETELEVKVPHVHDDTLGMDVQPGEAVVIVNSAAARAAQVAGAVILPWNNGEFLVINGHWYYLKRWLGNEQHIANVYSKFSRQQAISLLEGFCRADGVWSSIKYDDRGEPTGMWRCSNSSFPLIDHLMLIGQLAGAAVDLHLDTLAGTSGSSIDGRAITYRVNHWALMFTFNKSRRGIPFQTAPLAEPVNVSGSSSGRGYYDHVDDGRVWDITVQGNSNFLTQRLANKRLQSGRDNVRAHSVFTGNCTEAGMFALRERRVHVTQEDFEMATAKVMKKDSDKDMSAVMFWK